jgi:hypothetical protein
MPHGTKEPESTKPALTTSVGKPQIGRRLSGAEFLNLMRAASPPIILEAKDFQHPHED